MSAVDTDMTIFPSALADLPAAGTFDEALVATIADAFYQQVQPHHHHHGRMLAWLKRYQARRDEEGVPPDQRKSKMNAVNPRYVLRNYLAQLAIDQAEEGDLTGVRELLEVMRRPYEDQPGRDAFAAKRPEWARNKAGCSMLSCSS